MMMDDEETFSKEEVIKISFGYQCNLDIDGSFERNKCIGIQSTSKLTRASSSFSCLTGAALSANPTLANTNICNGLIASEILPTLDSPRSFRKIPSCQKLDLLSSIQSSMSSLSLSPPSPCDVLDSGSFSLKSTIAQSDSFLNMMDLQIAGGAAGEDRVQAVCSEENGWLFCGIYDGFNGRDAADFLAVTLYEKITSNLNLLSWGLGSEPAYARDILIMEKDSKAGWSNASWNSPNAQNVLESLQNALNQAESEFLYMVEQEMDERPDLVCIGSCVLAALLHGKNLYLLSLGDSRAVLATFSEGIGDVPQAVQLTECHTVDNAVERSQLVNDHPDDPHTIVGGKVKGKLKVTRAFGVGYLKRANLNDALMGILRVRNLVSPPYISLQPSLRAHKVADHDHFVVLASDGLFDFFSNNEVVKLVHSYLLHNPYGDPAKYLVERLEARAAHSAGFSMEELRSVPLGRRRKYHDDATVIVIVLGSKNHTSKASTFL